jgi:CRP/FNR family cyclic AMP-dependent transcriptional regulator
VSQAHISNASSALHRLFIACGKKRKLKKRDLLIPYMETPKHLYMVTQGSLRVELSNTQNEGVVCISHLKPGDMFGEQGLFVSVPMMLATATIQARCDVELLCVAHEDLKRAAHSAPSIYTELSAHINTRLGETTEKLFHFVFGDLEQRCYQSLVEVTRLPDALTHPDGMQISLTRIELSQMIGCSRESAGRSLKVLRDKGKVEVNGSRIVVYGIRHGLPVKELQSRGAACV